MYVLTASPRRKAVITDICADQVGAAIEGFIWPKIFWDFLTKNLDPAVKPIPILQTINLIFGLGMLALEWPLSFVAGSSLHRSLEFRLAVLPLTALTSILMYQSTNPAIYYVIGMVVYFVAYSEGEVCLGLETLPRQISMLTWNEQMICAKPWTLPQRGMAGLGLRA